MKLSDLSLQTLKCFITGDEAPIPYPRRSGKDMVDFFNLFGTRDVYKYGDGGLPEGQSRKEYAVSTLIKLNATKHFRSLIEALADSRTVDSPDEVAAAINDIIKHDNYKLVKTADDIYKISGHELSDPIEIEAHFQDIKNQILDQINQAEFLIWVAVAWFTDKDLGNALLNKHKAGINVQVITTDDKISQQHGLNFSSKGIEHYRIAPDSEWGKKIMHHKFCIIDLKKVIHGSFNWTNNANYNNEDITVTECTDLTASFAREFIGLKALKK